MNRRDFLRSTTGLALAPAIVGSQKTFALAGRQGLEEPWKTLEYFSDHVRDRRILQPEVVFGASVQRLIELEATVCRRLIEPDFDYRPSRFTVKSLAKTIATEVDKIASEEKVEEGTALKQRMLATGISAWVRTHIPFNEALPVETVPHETQALYWTSATLLKQSRIFAVCAGYARLTQNLAEALGLKSLLVNGVLRDPGNSIPPRYTHSWNVFEFDVKESSSFYCPCDNTIGRINLKVARNLKGKIHHPECFPVYPAEWGYFLWRQRATAMDGDKPPAPEIALDTWDERTWRRLDRRTPEKLIPKVEAWFSGATIKIIP